MADAAKKKLPMFTTPAGTAKYPWVSKADTRFKPEGEYHTGLLLSQEEAQPIIEMVDATIAELVKEALVKLKTKNKKAKESDVKRSVLPYKAACDDQGEETGEIELGFKQKAIIKNAKGETFELCPKVFDASGKELIKTPAIYGGSILRVAYQIVPYNVPALGVGASLRLNAVQIIKLVSGGGDAASYGFGEEEGYVAGGDDDEAPAGESVDVPDETAGEF